MYFIVGGLSTGAVVARDRKGPAAEACDTSLFGKALPSPQPVRNMTGGFVVQTNWDLWVDMDRAACTAKMSAMPDIESKACDAYVRAVYGPESACGQLCQLYSDGRAEKASALLAEQRAEGVTPTQLLQILSSDGVRQDDTIFTTVMSPTTGEYATWLQHRAPRAGYSKGAEADAIASKLRFLLLEITGLTGSPGSSAYTSLTTRDSAQELVELLSSLSR